MNFFMKIFFSTVLIAAVTFSGGSFLLIDFQFRSALSREVTAAYEENDIIRYSINHELETIKDNRASVYSPKLVTDSEEMRKQFIWQVAQSVTINTSKGTIPFRLNNNSYQTIFTSSKIGINNNILKEISENNRGYEIIQYDSQYYIHAAGPIAVQNETMYLENFHDITFLFKSRAEQYRIFYYLIIAIIGLSGLIMFMVSHWLTKPLSNLSKATKQIADGNFDQRITIKTQDEFGKLSEDFNTMAIKLEQMVEELKDASHRQEDFVGSFAHELKTPLTSMIGYADMLRSKKMETEQIIISSNYIFEEGKRLEALSMKLMDMIVLKKQDFTMKPVDAQAFFNAIQGVMLPVLEKENIEFIVNVEDAILNIEPDLMKTVCINLLDNARKAIDDGGKITFTGKWDLENYLITTQDTGKGMEESELSKITEAFYMVDKSRSRARGGAGLGLAISSEIIKLHGAEMKFQSALRKGTCVVIYLKGAEKFDKN